MPPQNNTPQRLVRSIILNASSGQCFGMPTPAAKNTRRCLLLLRFMPVNACSTQYSGMPPSAPDNTLDCLLQSILRIMLLIASSGQYFQLLVQSILRNASSGGFRIPVQNCKGTRRLRRRLSRQYFRMPPPPLASEFLPMPLYMYNLLPAFSFPLTRSQKITLITYINRPVKKEHFQDTHNHTHIHIIRNLRYLVPLHIVRTHAGAAQYGTHEHISFPYSLMVHPILFYPFIHTCIDHPNHRVASRISSGRERNESLAASGDELLRITPHAPRAPPLGSPASLLPFHLFFLSLTPLFPPPSLRGPCGGQSGGPSGSPPSGAFADQSAGASGGPLGVFWSIWGSIRGFIQPSRGPSGSPCGSLCRDSCGGGSEGLFEGPFRGPFGGPTTDAYFHPREPTMKLNCLTAD